MIHKAYNMINQEKAAAPKKYTRKPQGNSSNKIHPATIEEVIEEETQVILYIKSTIEQEHN